MQLTQAKLCVFLTIVNIVTAQLQYSHECDEQTAEPGCPRACQPDGTCKKQHKECVCYGRCGPVCLKKGSRQECARRDTEAAGRGCGRACQQDGTCNKQHRVCVCVGQCGPTCKKKSAHAAMEGMSTQVYNTSSTTEILAPNAHTTIEGMNTQVHNNSSTTVVLVPNAHTTMEGMNTHVYNTSSTTVVIAPSAHTSITESLIEEGRTSSSTVEAVNVNAPVYFTGTEQFTYDNKVVFRNRAQFNNVFRVSIRTNQEQGLILWNGPVDFIGLAVVDGYVTFAYQLGSGTLQIASTVFVSDGVFHTIRAIRHTRQGFLQVDNEEPVLAVSAPGASQLNTDGVLFVGGAPNVPTSRLPNGFQTNFVGCIGYLEIEEQPCHLYFDVIGVHPTQFCSLR